MCFSLHSRDQQTRTAGSSFSFFFKDKIIINPRKYLCNVHCNIINIVKKKKTWFWRQNLKLRISTNAGPPQNNNMSGEEVQALEAIKKNCEQLTAQLRDVC